MVDTIAMKDTIQMVHSHHGPDIHGGYLSYDGYATPMVDTIPMMNILSMVDTVPTMFIIVYVYSYYNPPWKTQKLCKNNTYSLQCRSIEQFQLVGMDSPGILPVTWAR